jgi:hypothetical protein
VVPWQLLCLQLAQVTRTGIQALFFAGDFVHDVEQLSSQSAHENRALGDKVPFNCVVEDFDELLHPSKGKGRNEDGAAPADRFPDAVEQAARFGATAALRRTLRQPAGGLDNDGIKGALGKARAMEEGGIFKEDISGVENPPMTMLEENAASSRDVTCREEGYGQTFTTVAVQEAGLAGGYRDHTAINPGNIRKGIERVILNAFFLPLTFHEGAGVLQEPFVELGRCMAEEDGRPRMLTNEDGEGTQMVEVTVGEDAQVEVAIPNLLELGQCAAANFLGMEAGIHENGKRAHFEEQAIGPDAAGRIQVGQEQGSPVVGLADWRTGPYMIVGVDQSVKYGNAQSDRFLLGIEEPLPKLIS